VERSLGLDCGRQTVWERSEEYFKALHSVLTGERSSPNAAADLERELVRITGFKTKAAVSTRVQPR